MQGAPQAAALQSTLGVHPDPPPLQVVRGGQGLGAGPGSLPHNPPRRPVDEGLPGDVGLLLGPQCQQLALEGDLGRLLLCLLPIGLTDFGLRSFKHLWLLDHDGGLKVGAGGGGEDEADVLDLNLLQYLLTLDSCAGVVCPLPLSLHRAPECLLSVLV